MEIEQPTEQDLILALEELFNDKPKRPTGALLTKEIVAMLREEGINLGRPRLRDILAHMKKDGSIEVCPVPIRNLADDPQTVKGYRLVRKDKND